MKFRDISERVKGGKLDPLSKMGKQKLTGQEVARYYKDNPKAKQAAKDPLIKKAIELALDLGGAYSYAVKEIGKLNRNLPRHPEVKKALQTANESVNEISEAHFATYHTPNQKKSMKDFIALAKKMPGVSDVTSEKQKNSRGQPIFRTSYKTDNRTADKLQKQQSALEKKYKEESVNEGVSVSDERIVNKGKGIIIMIDDNGKKVSAIFKDKKNADKFNRNKPSDVKKLLKLAKSKKYPKAIDENEMTSTSSVAMPEIPLGRKHKVMKRKELEEASMTYRIRKAQKPEIDNMMKGARMMKLKVTGNRVKTVGADPKRKTGDTEITVSGTAKNLKDFDAVVRGKSSYGDPSLIKEESATMKKVRQVVKKKGMMNIDGMKLDLTTASMIASVYDKVNPTNKKRMDKLKLPQLVNLTMKVAGKGKMKKEDAVERAKELADLKAKHKREVEQEKDEIAATKQTNESLWRNIHNKRKSGKKMRKPGEKGAPTAQDFKNARGESVSEAPQSKKFQMTFTDKQPKSLDHFLRMIKTQERATASSGIPTIKLLKKTKKGKNTVVDFMSGPNMQIKSINDIMTNVKKKFKEELEEAVSPNQQAMLKRVKERFPRLGKAEQEKIAKIVKPKGQIDSTLYLALGNAYDKRDLKALKTLMTNYGKKYKIEAVSPAQQAAIAISKKERGEKPKNECADEKDFKPHKMYKGDKEVMANTYADHVKYDKMGYSHEKPKKEALDAKDKPFVKDLVKKLRGGSKTHAKQADDLEKAMNTESMSRAKRDAMRDMGTRKDRDDDGNPVATADDRKAADKNVVMQIRRVTDLSKPAQIELRNGKKVMLKPADAKMMMKKFDAIRKPQDRLKVQNAMNDKKMTVQGLKRLLGR